MTAIIILTIVAGIAISIPLIRCLRKMGVIRWLELKIL